jgi:hypothetical protein
MNNHAGLKNYATLSMAAAVLSAGFLFAGVTPLRASGTVVPNGFVQSHDWDAPPEEMDEVARHGFHDGIEGARKDYEQKRRPDVNNRDEFKHPHVPERDREAYRRGFERGYQVGVDHIYHEQK